CSPTASRSCRRGAKRVSPRPSACLLGWISIWQTTNSSPGPITPLPTSPRCAPSTLRASSNCASAPTSRICNAGTIRSRPGPVPRPDSFGRRHDLARIHDVVRIERARDGAQQVQFHVAAVAAHGIQLELPDAVFGAEAAVEALHDVVHGCSDGLNGGDEI